MRPPEVYRAINAVTAALSGDGILRSRTNPIELYQYRSIDDLLNRLAPLVAEHRLCILPQVIAHRETNCGEPFVRCVSERSRCRSGNFSTFL